MSRFPNRRPVPTSEIFILLFYFIYILFRTNTERILMKFEESRLTVTNRWSNWLHFGRNFRRRAGIWIDVKTVLPSSEWLHKFHSAMHTLSAGLVSPLHTCSGGGIIWPNAVFSSVVYYFTLCNQLTCFLSFDEWHILLMFCIRLNILCRPYSIDRIFWKKESTVYGEESVYRNPRQSVRVGGVQSLSKR